MAHAKCQICCERDGSRLYRRDTILVCATCHEAIRAKLQHVADRHGEEASQRLFKACVSTDESGSVSRLQNLLTTDNEVLVQGP